MPTVSSPSYDPGLDAQVFWVKHRTELVIGVLVVLLALGGYAGYRFYRDRHNSAAAAMLAGAATEQDYRKIIDQYGETPASASAILLLAEKQRADKKYADANATLKVFVDQHPKHQLVTTARMAMASNLESLGKKDEALAIYQLLVSNYPQDYNAPLALLSQVHLLKEKNKIEDARRVCETIMTQYRDSLVSGEASRQLRTLRPAGETSPAKSEAVPVPNPAATGGARPVQTASVSKPAAVPQPKP